MEYSDPAPFSGMYYRSNPIVTLTTTTIGRLHAYGIRVSQRDLAQIRADDRGGVRV
jgi:hypothetical protein